MLSAGKHTKMIIFTWLHFSYIIFLGIPDDEDGLSRVAGSSIFTFQKVKRGHGMAQTGESLHSPLSYIHSCVTGCSMSCMYTNNIHRVLM